MRNYLIEKQKPPLELRSNRLFDNSIQFKYKEIGSSTLKCYIFSPNKSKLISKNSKVPCVFFFNGGTWDVNVVTQFAPHCHHYANLGFLSGVVDYRVSSNNSGNSPLESIQDARTFVRWLRYNSDSLNIDPDKIILGGASSGAHLALSTLFKPSLEFDDPDEDLSISCIANACILFEPITDTTKKGIGESLFPDKSIAKKSSPLHNIEAKSMPPMIILHGTHDRNISIEYSYKYAKVMKKKKNRCDLNEFDGRDSGFFNFNVNSELFVITLNQIDHFLHETDFLKDYDGGEENIF